MAVAASSPNIYRRYGCFNYLYQIYKQAGESALSNHYADSSLIYSDSISTLQNQNGVAELTLQYKRDLKEQQAASVQKQNILYVVIILVLLGLIFVSLILRNRQMRIAYQRKLAEVKLQYINQMAQTDDASLNAEIREESSRDVMRKQQLQLACEQFAKTRYGKRLVAMPLENEKLQQTLSHKEREALKERICYVFSDCILELKFACPSINNEDVIYCMLSALKYNNSVIAECVNVSNGTLRSRKSRLKTKLPPALFDLYF